MKQFVLYVPDNRYNFFHTLMKSLDFVKFGNKREIKLTAEQYEFVEGLKQSLREVELHQQGKIKLQSAREFLNEL